MRGVEQALPAWARREAARLLSAWNRLSPEALDETLDAAEAAGREAGRRIAGELTLLFALDPLEQRATPLEIVRGAVRELTAVLAEAGLPEVVRDEFSERAWPDDRYGLVPHTFRDLDPDLAAVHFAWGMAKTKVFRAGQGQGDS